MMCGIAGFVGRGSEDDGRRMILSLKHRGPDHQGVGFFGDVALASARLAIIDISPDGNQPMTDEKRRVALVFNGEIYNFQELRDELLATGNYRFRSRSDTEVILRAYQEYGERCFEKLNGMFALALYDFEKKQLILARDRMGEKPLYYGVFGETLIFGSELKALLAHPHARRVIDLGALARYLVHDYVPTPHSIFCGIRKLEPGNYLVWEKGKEERRVSFWPRLAPPVCAMPFGAALSGLESLLVAAVRLRLIADVPLGVFLSGGIDSGAVAYFARRHIPAGRMKTFSIGFEDPTFDETVYAREVAQYLGSDHTEYRIQAADMLGEATRLPDIADEPLADSSLIPMAILCRLARKDVTVTLSGDGGDELFAGYPTFRADSVANFYARMPHWFRKNIMPKLTGLLPVSDSYMNFGFRARKLFDGLSGDTRYRHHLWLGSFAPQELGLLMTPEAGRAAAAGQEEIFAALDRLMDNAPGEDPGNRLLYLYQKTYLLDQVLVKVDRASMAYALEVRSPFLDHRLVEFMNDLPYGYKYRGLTLKYMLKKLMADRLPRRIISRKKKGFGAPVSGWLKKELRPLAEETLLSARVSQDGFLNTGFVRKLLEDHFASRADNGKKLWTLLQFQLWRERWLPK